MTQPVLRTGIRLETPRLRRLGRDNRTSRSRIYIHLVVGAVGHLELGAEEGVEGNRGSAGNLPGNPNPVGHSSVTDEGVDIHVGGISWVGAEPVRSDLGNGIGSSVPAHTAGRKVAVGVEELNLDGVGVGSNVVVGGEDQLKLAGVAVGGRIELKKNILAAGGGSGLEDVEPVETGLVRMRLVNPPDGPGSVGAHGPLGEVASRDRGRSGGGEDGRAEDGGDDGKAHFDGGGVRVGVGVGARVVLGGMEK